MSNFRNVRRWSFIDVAFWSIMVGTGESYVSAFALAYGFSERFAGLLSVIPLGIASIIQLFTGQLLPFFKSRRKFIVACAVLQAISLLAIMIQPNLKGGAQEGLILLLTCYWSFGLSAGPIWNAWIVSLIPPNTRLRFFADRGRLHEIMILASLIGGGLVLYLGHGSIKSFTFLFLIAALARFVSAYALAQHPEESRSIKFQSPLVGMTFLNWLFQKKVIGLLIFIGLFQFGVSIGSPYFTPFLLKRLGLSYHVYMLVLSIPFISRAFAYRYIEKFVGKYGIQSVLLVNVLVIANLPFIWAFYADIYVIIGLQIIAGFAWAGFEYCVLLSQISDFSDADRSRILTWSNLVVGLSTIFGVILGSTILGAKPSKDSYSLVFSISASFRYLPLILVFARDWKTTGSNLKHVFIRIVGIRLNRGPVSRPIILEDDEKS